MSSQYEVEVTVLSAQDTKNVNWKHGRNKPYAVIWVDPRNKCSSKVDETGDVSPVWDEKLLIPLPPGTTIVDETELHIDIVHSGREDDTKPIIGSVKVNLREILDEAGDLKSPVRKSLKLKRPSGRPHGKLDVAVEIRNPYRQPPCNAYDAPAYGVPQQPPYGAPYSTAPPSGYCGSGTGYGQPAGYAQPSGYGQPSGYRQPAGYGQPAGYSQPAGYGQASGYNQSAPTYVATSGHKKKGMGVGAGLAVGAAAGVLGGIALAAGVEAFEDHVADKVRDDLAYDDY